MVWSSGNTLALVIACLFAISISDTLLFAHGGGQWTVSYALGSLARLFPLTVIASGYLCGHLYWSRIDPLQTWSQAVSPLSLLLLGLLAARVSALISYSIQYS